MRVDEWCRTVMTSYLRIMILAITTRKKTKYTSYEREVYIFLCSRQFTQFGKQSLPACLAKNHPGCGVLALCLDRRMATVTKECLTASRMVRNPELFNKETNDVLSKTEQNSEVNRFLGWAIFSSMPHFGMGSLEMKILRSMRCRVGDVDNGYLAKYYDRNMSLLNTGGLTLVGPTFFHWGIKVLQLTRVSLTEETLHKDPKHGFAKGKTLIVENRSFVQHFKALCKKNTNTSDQTKIDCAASAVYLSIVNKVVHSRFSVPFRLFKEKNIRRRKKLDCAIY